MKHAIMSVRDLATESFGRPFTVPHIASAHRSFSDEANNSESEIAKHAEDYELWCLGTFDDTTGQLITEHERIARATDLKRA